jgi:hypothetical protein
MHTSRALLLAAAAMLAFAGSDASAAAAKAKPKAKPAAAAATRPDWGGVWDPDWSKLFGAPQEQPQLTPPYAEKLKAFQDAQKGGENAQTAQANCLPPGLPGIMSQPYPLEFLFANGKVTIVIEAFNQMRRVYLDGRKHPAEYEPLWYGHSIGHWEGDTLVVDTVSFDPATELGGGIHHSDKLHVVERIHLISPDRMEIAMTFDDPEALTKPWTTKREYTRHRDWDIKEYICEQNNRDAADSEGRPSMKLN